MPGILPMKMIRVGVTTQSRIAQACDRCRSKKIRCDGVRPCCTQCANVGFECKTSDKLSRRAFPRGYTESLEDRVRGLEAEVRELKGLLDEKDEKIDMLSRIHNFSPRSRKISLSATSTTQVKAEDESPREDIIVVEIPAAVHPVTSAIGNPTTAALIEAFDQRAQDSKHDAPNIAAASFLKPQHVNYRDSAIKVSASPSPAPPRLLSDQYINLFFQEWQPLLPVLHRPTFLKVYESYLAVSDAHSWKANQAALAQLFLIFEIAAYSASSKTKPVTTVYELQWRKALSSISSTPSISTLQSFVLAQLCCLLKADYPHLLRYRAYAVSMMHQLGLHQGHKNHPLSLFDAETRKKVFWCQYVLDKFTSAATGTPQLIHESDVSVEYPTDVDDENISTQGVSPTLPGELTKISSALAFFRLSRKLAKTLDTLYPSKAKFHISLNKLHALSDELDQWQEELPDHLRLRFRNDKPATNLISCRSPLLSLAYFYVRSLIHRPLLCYGSDSAASAATIVLAAAAKHQLQIIDLLDERSMNYTFPLSKQDLLLNAGFSILWQTCGLDADSKLLKDNRRSLLLMLNKLSRESSLACRKFQTTANPFVPLSDTRPQGQQAVSAVPDEVLSKAQSARKQLQAIASRLSSFNGKSKNEEGNRRASISQQRMYQSVSPGGRANSSVSLSSTRSAPAVTAPTIESDDLIQEAGESYMVNLDYFPLGDDIAGFATNNSSSTMLPPKKSSPPVTHRSSWDNLAGSISASPLNACRTVSAVTLDQATSMANISNDWPTDLWEISTYDLDPKQNGPQSLLSFSEESLTSDDLLFSAAGSHNGSTGTNDNLDGSIGNTTPEQFQGINISSNDEFDFQAIPA